MSAAVPILVNSVRLTKRGWALPVASGFPFALEDLWTDSIHFTQVELHDVVIEREAVLFLLQGASINDIFTATQVRYAGQLRSFDVPVFSSQPVLWKAPVTLHKLVLAQVTHYEGELTVDQIQARLFDAYIASMT